MCSRSFLCFIMTYCTNKRAIAAFTGNVSYPPQDGHAWAASGNLNPKPPYWGPRGRTEGAHAPHRSPSPGTAHSLPTSDHVWIYIYPDSFRDTANHPDHSRFPCELASASPEPSPRHLRISLSASTFPLPQSKSMAADAAGEFHFHLAMALFHAT
jgi:hypothetical protein